MHYELYYKNTRLGTMHYLIKSSVALETRFPHFETTLQDIRAGVVVPNVTALNRVEVQYSP